jgi:hypothetical protein
LVKGLRGLDAIGADGSSGSTSADANVVHDDEYDSMYVGAADDGDARTLPPSVDDLEEQWQAMHGQLWRAPCLKVRRSACGKGCESPIAHSLTGYSQVVR